MSWYTGYAFVLTFFDSQTSCENTWRSITVIYCVLHTTWWKTNKSNRSYSIEFSYKTKTGNPTQYIIPGTRGPTYTSVGKVITWYLEVSNLMNSPGQSLLFPNLSQISDRRGVFTRWLWLYATYPARGTQLYLLPIHRIQYITQNPPSQ